VLLVSLLALGVWSDIRSTALAKAEGLAETEARPNKSAQEQARIACERAEDPAWEDYVNRVNRVHREVQDDNVALAKELLNGCPAERCG
jgi:hypothetical protein